MARVGELAIWTVYFIIFVDFFQLTFVYPFLPTLIVGLPGGSVSQIALVNTMNAAGEAIGCPIFGALADRFGRRPVLLVSTLGSAVSASILGLSSSYWMVIVARVINGLTGGTISIANAYVADVTDPHERPVYMSKITAALGLGLSLGPLAGSALYLLWGIDGACYSAGGVSLLNFVCILLFLPESKVGQPGSGAGGAAIQPDGHGGLGDSEASMPSREPTPARISRSLPLEIWILFLVGFLQSPVQVVFDTFGNPYVTDRFFDGDEKRGTQFFSLCVSAIGIIVFVVPFLFYASILKCVGFRATIFMGGIAGVTGFICNAVAPVPWCFLVSCMVWVFGLVLIGPAIPTMITQHAHPSQFGRALGLFNSCRNIALVAGPSAAAPLYNINPSFIFYGTAVLLAVVSVILVMLSFKPSGELSEEQMVRNEQMLETDVFEDDGSSAPALLRQLTRTTSTSARIYGNLPGQFAHVKPAAARALLRTYTEPLARPTQPATLSALHRACTEPPAVTSMPGGNGAA